MASKRLRLSILATVMLLFGTVSLVQGQTTKQINKCVKIFLEKDQAKGIEKLRGYIYDALFAGEPTWSGYEMWVKMEFARYSQYAAIEIDVEPDENGETDSTVYEIFQTLIDGYKETFLDVCRKSTLESSSSTGEMYLRKYLVDYDPDTAVNEKAKEYFKEAEEFFGKEDYELAELNYRKALAEDSTYYAALLYLGDTFWAREDYDSAVVFFTMAKNMHPDLMEPRHYIVDGLMEQGLYYRAKVECLEAMLVYPGYDCKWRLQRILEVENRVLNEHRFVRLYYPNNMKNDEQGDLTGIPGTYRETKFKISKYCNEDGIIEPNGLTEDKYLEVYSFRRMLEENEDELPESMKFGYKMMEEGYLEPYVFISMFHVDIYPQFKHYMSFEENRKKSLDYIENYLIESRPKE